MKIAALIVAAGRGSRLNADIPKQYIPLNGPCALHRSINIFLSVSRVKAVACVIHPADLSRYNEVVEQLASPALHAPVIGGDTRGASVFAGLNALSAFSPDAVLIHDAARPFMPMVVINGVIDALKDTAGACAALPVVDALWADENGKAGHSVARDGLWRAQTPQGFHFDAILAAYETSDGSAADDVAVARAAGIEVSFVPGSEAGYKITTADDLARALRDTA